MDKKSVNTYRYSDFNEQELVKKYDKWYERNRFAYLSEVNAIKEVMSKGLGLEVGVGTGRFASVLKIPFGLDPAEKCLKLAYQRGVKVIRASGEYLPFPDETFDYLLMTITLSFLKDPLQALHEANRVLNQGARIIVGIIDRNSFLGELYQKEGDKGHSFYRDAELFTSDEAINLLNENEFKTLKIYQTIFRLPKNLKNIEKPIEGYGKGSFVVISAKKQ